MSLDGGGEGGFNIYSTRAAFDPALAEFNGKLYGIWTEANALSNVFLVQLLFDAEKFIETIFTNKIPFTLLIINDSINNSMIDTIKDTKKNFLVSLIVYKTLSLLVLLR